MNRNLTQVKNELSFKSQNWSEEKKQICKDLIDFKESEELVRTKFKSDLSLKFDGWKDLENNKVLKMLSAECDRLEKQFDKMK